MNKEFYPLVTIVIPVYNGANYLSEAIDSALGQTYSNIEIIVVNDGSCDDNATEKIALSYGNKIRYYKKKNAGVASALNLGIEMMQGTYFSWLSHDDFYMPEKIEKSIEVLSQIDNKKTIIYSNYQLIDANRRLILGIDLMCLHRKKALNDGLYAVVSGCLNGCTMLIHKDVFTQYGVFNTSLRNTQDYELWYRILKNGNQPIEFIREYLVLTRVHNQQESKKAYNNDECDRLWISILSDISKAQFKRSFGSEQVCLQQFENQYKLSGYDGVLHFVRDRLRMLRKQHYLLFWIRSIKFYLQKRG